jgi:hypothetical protein
LATVVLRSRPQIAGLSGVPLFLEAMTAVIFERCEPDLVDAPVLSVPVDLATQQVSLRCDRIWTAYGIELSRKAIRNVAIAAVYGGEPA